MPSGPPRRRGRGRRRAPAVTPRKPNYPDPHTLNRSADRSQLTAVDLAAMAARLLHDGHASIADRLIALGVAHRLRCGIPVAAEDQMKLRVACGKRRRQLAEAAGWWAA